MSIASCSRKICRGSPRTNHRHLRSRRTPVPAITGAAEIIEIASSMSSSSGCDANAHDEIAAAAFSTSPDGSRRCGFRWLGAFGGRGASGSTVTAPRIAVAAASSRKSPAINTIPGRHAGGKARPDPTAPSSRDGLAETRLMAGRGSTDRPLAVDAGDGLRIPVRRAVPTPVDHMCPPQPGYDVP